MFLVDIQKNQVKVNQTEPLTSGSSKVYLVYFNFSDEWQDLARVAVFNVGDTTINVLLDEKNVCFIPWEVLTKAGVPVRFGVYGTRDGDVVLPTIWAQTPTILQGVVTGIDGQEPTPDVYQQLLGRLEEILDKINNGDFGGDGSGVVGPQGPQGEKGDPGVTFLPTVSEEGVISWTNDGDLTNPEPVNIRGPQGPKGDGVALVPGSGVTIQDGIISVDTPVEPITGEDYDSLSEDERKDKVFLITDRTEMEVERLSLEEYDTDDGWHVRKWSDGYVEMIYHHDYTITAWSISDKLYFPYAGCPRTIPAVPYPEKLTTCYAQTPVIIPTNGTVSPSVGGVSAGVVFTAGADYMTDNLSEIPACQIWTQTSKYTGPITFVCTITGRWK